MPWNSGTGQEVIKQALKWAKIFGDQHRVIHVMRNPEGVKQSNIRLGWMSRATLDNRVESSVRNVHNNLKHLNYMAFRLEDLGLEPYKVLTEIYNFCGLNIDSNTLDSIIKGKPNNRKKVGRAIEKQVFPPYRGYEEFIL